MIDTQEDSPATRVVKEQIQVLEEQREQAAQQMGKLQVAIVRMEGGIIALKAILASIAAIADNGETGADP